MTIGSQLRQAREDRGITLREISDRTKIRPAVLRAIENDDFQHAPGGVIMRGFLKLYAREVGLDADDIAQRFAAALDAGPIERPGAATRDAAEPDHVARQAGRRIAPWVVGAVVVAAMAVAAYVVSRPTPGGPAGEDRSQAAAGADAGGRRPGASAETAAASPAAARTAPPPGPDNPTPPAATRPGSDVMQIDVRATAASWLSARVDGEQVAYRLLNPGDRVSLSVKNEAVLRIGIPPNVTVSINGTATRPFGRPGMPATLRITPGNYRDLLVP